MSGRRKTGGVFIGVSSLLVIFIVLCLTTFAALSLMSANADLKMARRAAQTVSEYYAARQPGGRAARPGRRGRGGESRAAAGRGGLLRAPGPGARRLLYRPHLRRAGAVRRGALSRPRGARHEILRWQAASTREWQGDETIELWDGTL